MAEGNKSSSLVDLGDLGKFARTATVFVEKVSAGLGCLYKPTDVRRIAKAEADAAKIRASSAIEVSALEQRGMERLAREQGKHQDNMEKIIRGALPLLREEGTPDQMDEDWIAHFFARARLTSNADMQALWARLLATQANAPGSFSKRTTEFVASLERDDAERFTKLCSFVWTWPVMLLLVYDPTQPVYEENGASFSELMHFESLGLINFESMGGLTANVIYDGAPIRYFERKVDLVVPGNPPQFSIGRVMLTNIGRELVPIAGGKPLPGYFDSVLKKWRTLGYTANEV